MTNKTALTIVGGIAVGTVAVGVASLVVWSVVPMTIWGLTATVIGSQTMNVLRIKSGQLQPTCHQAGESKGCSTPSGGIKRPAMASGRSKVIAWFRLMRAGGQKLPVRLYINRNFLNGRVLTIQVP